MKAIPWGITLILESLYSLRRFSSDFAQQINNGLHLTRKYPPIFVYEHYVFQERRILVNFLAKRRLLKFFSLPISTLKENVYFFFCFYFSKCSLVRLYHQAGLSLNNKMYSPLQFSF